jgi:hypothetical protein
LSTSIKVFVNGGVEEFRVRHPADQILDQRLRRAAIDVVMAHVIADAVGAPAEREFGEIAGADDEAAFLVGETEEVVGAQARLHVFVGDIVHRFAARGG